MTVMNHAPSSRTGKLLIRPTSGEPGWRRQRTGRHIQGEGIPLKGPGREPMTLWSHACRHRRNHSHSVVDSMCWWLTEWATGKVLSGQGISSISRDPKSWLPAINTHQHLRPTGGLSGQARGADFSLATAADITLAGRMKAAAPVTGGPGDVAGGPARGSGGHG